MPGAKEIIAAMQADTTYANGVFINRVGGGHVRIAFAMDYGQDGTVYHHAVAMPVDEALSMAHTIIQYLMPAQQPQAEPPRPQPEVVEQEERLVPRLVSDTLERAAAGEGDPHCRKRLLCVLPDEHEEMCRRLDGSAV